MQRGIYDEVVEQLAEKVARMAVGNGMRAGVTIGPLIDERAVEKSDEHVQDAIEHGARSSPAAARSRAASTRAARSSRPPCSPASPTTC